MTSWLFWAITASILTIQSFTLFTMSAIGRHLMSTQEVIDAVAAQLAKAKDEILTKIADLNAQIAEAGVADQVDTSALTAVAQALDDVVPDAAPTE